MQNEVSKWSHYSPLNLKYEASPFGLLTHIRLCLSVLVPELTSSSFCSTTIQWISASSNSPHGIHALTRIIYSKCINNNKMEWKPCEIVFTNYVNNWEMAKKKTSSSSGIYLQSRNEEELCTKMKHCADWSIMWTHNCLFSYGMGCCGIEHMTIKNIPNTLRWTPQKGVAYVSKVIDLSLLTCCP